jgi:hypothetical protein
VIFTPVPMVGLMQLFLSRFFGLVPTPLGNLDIVVQYRGNDGDHVGLDNSCPHSLGASNAYVDDTLKGQAPSPHVHHVFAATLLEDADQPLDAAIDCEDVPDAG